MARIVHLANFFGPRSGGLRTMMVRLAEGYQAAGHETHLIVPAQPDGWRQPTSARVHALGSVRVPRSGGYRVVWSASRIRQVLTDIRPDVVELSDRLTLLSAARWARRQGVPCTLFAHERVDGVMAEHAPRLPGTMIADHMNTRIAAEVDCIVTTTRYAAAEFDRLGITTHHVPLGVDTDRFRPRERAWAGTGDDRLELALCSRLSREKHPQQAIDVLAEAVRQGRPWHLTVIGDGPLLHSLRRHAAGLPVTFLGFLPSPDAVAARLQHSDVVLAPGPIETFGLAALEALACGTPVVCSDRSALPEVIGDAGSSAGPRPCDWVKAIDSLVPHRDHDARTDARRRARERALSMPWDNTVVRMLALHGLAGGTQQPAERPLPIPQAA
jgi:alpha-1,6-mannosyltransferase